MSGRFELKVVGILENLSLIGDFIFDSMIASGLDARKIFEVQLAVDEACTNIIKYGYADEAGTINIICCMRNGELVVVIKDEGKPFDPTSVQPPDLNASLEERQMGGLGVHLIKTMMDEVRYESIDGKNVLTMVARCR